MGLLDDLPLDILLLVVKWLGRKVWGEPVFYGLLPVASVSTSLRRPLLPLLYRDLVVDFRRSRNYSTRHNASLARSAGCSGCAQQVALFVDNHTKPNDIVEAVRDDVDVGSEAKWPNLRSYTCIYHHGRWEADDLFYCSRFISQFDKELPRLRCASPAACEVSSSITPPAYIPPSVSFLTQLTSLYLDYDNQGIGTSCLPHLFAPTLVELIIYGASPENVWNKFYDSQGNQTVVFARLKYLDITFCDPFDWARDYGLPPHLQGATRGMLTKRSVWAAEAASGRPGCRVPLFPVLCTLMCRDMVYDFRDFISRTQCHNSLESLHVNNGCVYFDFDANLFKNLETVKFDTRVWGTDEETTGSVDFCKSAFTSLLRAKTTIQRMTFVSPVRDTRFQVPPDIGCINLHSLILGVEVDFKSMLRLLSSLKHLVKLELNVDYDYIPNDNDGQEDATEYINELLPFQADYPPVSSTLRSFACRLHRPREHRCYTASYALELALHLPTLESMTLGMSYGTNVASYKALLDRLLQELSGTPHMNGGFLNAKVISRYSTSWRKHFY